MIRPTFRAPLLGVLACLAPVVVCADEPAAVPGLLETSLRAGASLVGVLALIALLAFLVRRLQTVSAQRSGSAGLTSIGRLDLGSRREIRLVQVGERLLVVGVTSDRMQLLTALDPGSEGEQPAGAEPPKLSVLQELVNHS